jgi:hypothetical protein
VLRFGSNNFLFSGPGNDRLSIQDKDIPQILNLHATAATIWQKKATTNINGKRRSFNHLVSVKYPAIDCVKDVPEAQITSKEASVSKDTQL